MQRKAAIVIIMGLMAWLLSGCGGQSAAKSDETISSEIASALEAVPGVSKVNAKYKVITGMGSTTTIRVVAKADQTDLKSLLDQTVRAFAGMAGDLKKTSNTSFRVVNFDETDGINTQALGLTERPNIQDIIDYANK